VNDDWRLDAECTQLPPEMWFPKPGGGKNAKRICNEVCTVRDRCYEVGIDEEHGIWAGLSEAERRAIRVGRAA